MNQKTFYWPDEIGVDGTKQEPDEPDYKANRPRFSKTVVVSQGVMSVEEETTTRLVTENYEPLLVCWNIAEHIDSIEKTKKLK